MTIITILPYGSCAGVKHAKRDMEDLDALPRPFYLTDFPVHDPSYGARLLASGFLMLPEDDEDLHEGTVIVSAHGLSSRKRARLAAQGLAIRDLTCPFVARLHDEVTSALDAGEKVFFLGRSSSKETIELLAEGDVTLLSPGMDPVLPAEAHVFSQTTLPSRFITRLLAKNPGAKGTCGLCPDCATRQEHLLSNLPGADGVVIVGSPSSANAQSLAELARPLPSLFATSPALLPPFLAGKRTILLASATSADDESCREIRQALMALS